MIQIPLLGVAPPHRVVLALHEAGIRFKQHPRTEPGTTMVFEGEEALRRVTEALMGAPPVAALPLKVSFWVLRAIFSIAVHRFLGCFPVSPAPAAARLILLRGAGHYVLNLFSSSRLGHQQHVILRLGSPSSVLYRVGPAQVIASDWISADMAAGSEIDLLRESPRLMTTPYGIALAPPRRCSLCGAMVTDGEFLGSILPQRSLNPRLTANLWCCSTCARMPGLFSARALTARERKLARSL
jgi:hypothetical protein